MGKIPGCGPRPALAAACALALCLVPSVANADVTVALQTRLTTTSVTQQVPVLVTLRDQVDAARYSGHPAALIAALHREARRSSHQVPLVGPQRVRHFWLVNAVALSASPDQIARIDRDPDVASVDLDTTVHAADADTQVAAQKTAGTGDWGLAAVGARSVWDAYGVTGKGERIGVIDTGVDPSDPDLTGKIAAWHDFVNGRRDPVR